MDDATILTGWPEFWAEFQNALGFVRDRFVSHLFSPWGQFQIVLLVLVALLAHALARIVEPRFEAWLRSIDSTRQRLRLFAIFLRRLRLVFFVAGTSLALAGMRAATWPSRSYLIGVVASIATVWLIASLAGKLLRNRTSARIFTFIVWTILALQILGILPIAIALLDAAAVSIGDFRISALLLIKATALIAFLLWLANFTANRLEQRVQRIEDLSPSMRVLTGKLARILLYAVALVVGLQSTGLNLTGLTVFSGAIGLGIGFGLQKVVSNLISGVILLVDRSIKPGDVIEVGNTFGWIQTLGARYVSVVTRDGREYLIPNEDLITSQVINWSHTDPKVRLEITFGVSYRSDPYLVRRIAIEAAGKPKRVLGVPAPVCHVIGFGESSIDFVLRFWIADPSGGVVNIKSEVFLALWDALKENDIEIPYPHRVVQVESSAGAATPPLTAPRKRSVRSKA